MLKFVVVFLMFGCRIFAADLDVNLSVADTNYTLGDKILLQYKVKYGDNLRLIPPDFSNISPHFECLCSKFDSTSKILFITLISFEAGNFDLPAIPFLFEDIATKRLFTHLSNPHKLQIDSIKVNSNQIKDAKFEMLNERIWNLWGILGVTIVIAILICVFAIKFRTNVNK